MRLPEFDPLRDSARPHPVVGKKSGRLQGATSRGFEALLQRNPNPVAAFMTVSGKYYGCRGPADTIRTMSE